jgi:wyosine [tRNA(Phe)-imidazoG37] synthetase (radical SAM superfamily)
MSFVYGPVPSRRLGQSLGIDPIPFKTCNYNCVYCQLGRTMPVTHERQDYFPPGTILSEVESELERHGAGEIDFVTFVGQGEPLLCASLGWLIRSVKKLTEIPVAVITNGSLLFRKDVRGELQGADVVIPTLDAADQQTFRRINRPWRSLRAERIVEGLEVFRPEFEGQLWIEVMLVGGLNDTEPVLAALAQACDRIRPDRIQLNVPIRPPAEDWVKPTGSEGLLRAMTILGEAAEVVPPAEGEFDLREGSSLIEAIADILRRHPMRHRELVRTLRHVDPEGIQVTLDRLRGDERIRRRLWDGAVFWTSAEGGFGGEEVTE